MSGSREKRERARRTTRRFVVSAAIGAPLFLCCIPFGVLRPLGARAWSFDGPSMEPAYCSCDRALALPAGAVARGDVVVFRSPSDEVSVVKRVIAIGGDRIAIEDDVIVLNGERIEQRPLGDAVGSSTLACFEERIGDRGWQIVYERETFPDSMPEMVVPAGHVFVLGDHRDRSNDSRNPRIGSVPLDRVLGRVAYTYWSASERVRCPGDP